MGSSRRLVLKASRALVIAFSSARSALRCASHSSRDTTSGSSSCSSSRVAGLDTPTGCEGPTLAMCGPGRQSVSVSGPAAHGRGTGPRRTEHTTGAPGGAPSGRGALRHRVVRGADDAAGDLVGDGEDLDGRGGIDRERHVAAAGSRAGPTTPSGRCTTPHS